MKHDHTLVRRASAFDERPLPAFQSGAIRARVRENQLLPLAWRQLSPGDLWEIHSYLARLLARRLHDDGAIEACLAIAAILTTGRTLDDLHQLPILDSDPDNEHDGFQEALVLDSRGGTWIFTPGCPRARADQLPSANTIRGALPAPASPVVIELLKQRSGSPARPLPAQAPLFTVGKSELRSRIEGHLRDRRVGYPGTPRRPSRTLESLERFLTVAYTHEPGGDLASAVRLTASDEPLARSVIHYGTTRPAQALRRARRAAGQFFEDEIDKEVRSPRDNKILGSSFSPTDEQVRELRNALEADLTRSHKTLRSAHEAMTNQVVALVSFAIGHRGLGTHLPSLSAIDAATGFCSVHEKNISDPTEARLVWVAECAREQIRAYEEHLQSLTEHVSHDELVAIETSVENGRLPFFDIRSDGIQELRLASVWKRIRETAHAPSLQKNAGRHWLRSHLSGHCCTETLYAVFGHWQLGTEPWSHASTLDPIAFRSDLIRSIPAILEDAGWVPLKSPLAPGK